MKRAIAMLMAIVMIFSITPMSVYAGENPTVAITVGSKDVTVNPGDTISVPVVITQNDGLTGFTLGVEYDTTRLEVDKEKSLYTDGGLVPGIVYAENASYMGQADFTATGTIFTLNFKVKEDAPQGDASVIVKIVGNAEDAFYNEELEGVTLALSSNAIKVKYKTVGLSFVNGSQTMTYDEAKADAEGGNTLTVPGEDYHFVGWFSGLNDKYKEDETGYYVIEPDATETGIAGVELRPRYEILPTEGTYNALWIKGNGSYAVNVGESNIGVYVGETDSAVLNAAIAEANGARTKLVKDMDLKSTKVTSSVAMHLDLNGCKIITSTTRILTLTDTTGNVVESSREGGSFVSSTSTAKSQYLYGGQYDLIRDVEMTAKQGTDAVIDINGPVTIENCIFVGFVKLKGESESSSTIDNCQITNNATLIRAYGIVTVTNTKMMTTTTSNVAFLGDNGNGILNLGAGNTITATTAQYLFSNLKEVNFTSIEGCAYQVATTTMFVKEMNGFSTSVFAPNGLGTAIDASGKIVFGVPCSVIYIADGTIVKTLTGMKDGYADLSVKHEFGNNTQYELVGWTTDSNATEAMTEIILNGDTTLYAVKREKPTNVDGQPIQNETIEFGSSTSKLLNNAHKLGDLNELTLTQNSAWARLTFGSAVLDSIAANVVSGNLDVVIDYDHTLSEEGTFARLNVSLQKDGSDVTFDGAVNVRLRLGPSANVASRNYRVYYIPEVGDPVAMPTSIKDEGGNVYAYFTTTHFSTFEVRETEIANGYTAGLDITETEVRAGKKANGEQNTVNVTVDVTHSDKTEYNAGEIKVEFDSTLLSFNEIQSELPENAVCKVEGNELTIEFYGDKIAFPHKINLTFDTCDSVDVDITTTITLKQAAFADSLEAQKEDLQEATLEPASDVVTIKVEEVPVEKADEIVLGDETVVKGTDYNFTVAQPEDYSYDNLKVTVDGIDITDKLVKNEDGSYTIPAEFVTGSIVIEHNREANKYNVTINYTGDDPDEALVQEATYGEPFQFTIPTQDGYQYTLKEVIINGETFTNLESVGGNVYNIPGSAIKGEIIISIEKDDTLFTVTVEGNGAGDAEIADQNGETSFDKGDTAVLTITPAIGYKEYKVTATMNGEDVTESLDNSVENVYSLANIDGDIIFTVTKEVNGTVEVTEYLTLNSDDTNGNSLGMFLVRYTDELLKDEDTTNDYIPMCNDMPMYWSANYEAYCYLVIDENLDVAKSNVKVTAGTVGNNIEIAYTINVNGSEDENGDAADAQLVYDMYMAMYKDFTDDVNMMKFLLADTNNDKVVDVLDAEKIISTILGIEVTP